jgi:hypothetical protein
VADVENDTHHKALRINLDARCYGTIAEIGAGQDVARWFLQVGGASNTVAKTVSAGTWHSCWQLDMRAAVRIPECEEARDRLVGRPPVDRALRCEHADHDPVRGSRLGER